MVLYAISVALYVISVARYAVSVALYVIIMTHYAISVACCATSMARYPKKADIFASQWFCFSALVL